MKFSLPISFTIVCILFCKCSIKAQMDFEALPIEKFSESELANTEIEQNAASYPMLYDQDYWDGVFFEMFFELFITISIGVLFETPYEYENGASRSTITVYPYKQGNSGNFTYGWKENSTKFRSDFSYDYLAGNSNFFGHHGKLDLWFLRKVGLEAKFYQLEQKLRTAQVSRIQIYQGLLKYHRIRAERFNAWWGMGVTHIRDGFRQTGFSYGAGFDLFYPKPLGISANFRHTFLYADDMIQFATRLHAYFDGYITTVGYEYLSLFRKRYGMLAIGVGIALGIPSQKNP